MLCRLVGMIGTGVDRIYIRRMRLDSIGSFEDNFHSIRVLYFKGGGLFYMFTGMNNIFRVLGLYFTYLKINHSYRFLPLII